MKSYEWNKEQGVPLRLVGKAEECLQEKIYISIICG